MQYDFNEQSARPAWANHSNPPPPPARPIQQARLTDEGALHEYRIVKYHHGYLDKWAYNLERRLVVRFLFWQWEQWEWVAGHGASEMGHARRWMADYGVKGLISAPKGYRPDSRWQKPKRIIRPGSYGIVIVTYPAPLEYICKAILYRKFLLFRIKVDSTSWAGESELQRRISEWEDKYNFSSYGQIK